jgi:hypothetical protein
MCVVLAKHGAGKKGALHPFIPVFGVQTVRTRWPMPFLPYRAHSTRHLGFSVELPTFSAILFPSVPTWLYMGIIVLNLFVDGHVGLAPAAANHFFSQCHLPGISHPFCAIAIGAYLMMRCIALVYAVVNWRVIHMVPV